MLNPKTTCYALVATCSPFTQQAVSIDDARLVVLDQDASIGQCFNHTRPGDINGSANIVIGGGLFAAPHWRHLLVARFMGSLPVALQSYFLGSELRGRYEVQQREIEGSEKSK